MNLLVLLTIIGTISSFVSLLIAAKNLKSRIIHVIYALVLTIITGFFAWEISSTKAKIEIYEDMSNQAKSIIDSYYSTREVGKNRGFILTSFAFLEKYQKEIPETYSLAKQLIEEGIKITESVSEKDLHDKWDEEKRMDDGAKTMKSLLDGIYKKKK